MKRYLLITACNLAAFVTFSQTNTFPASGNVGIGTINPKVFFHNVKGTSGTMGFPYESAVFENNGDQKLGIYIARNAITNTAGCSLTLGESQATNTLGNYPGFEIQNVNDLTASGSCLRFNYLERNSSGSVQSALPNIMSIFGNGNVGIGTSAPQALLDVNGTAIIRSLRAGTSSDALLVGGANSTVGLLTIGNGLAINNGVLSTTGNSSFNNNNTYMGIGALSNINTSHDNTAFGYYALNALTTSSSDAPGGGDYGAYNTAVGGNALRANTTGNFNTALGYQSLLGNTSGYWNVAVGVGAMQSNTSGWQSTAIGTSASSYNTTGQQNVAVGEEALAGNIDGSYNTAIGTRAMWSIQNTSGETPIGHSQDNTAVGYEALKNITSAQENIAMGLHALENDSTGWYNVAIGNNALDGITYTHRNIAIGFQALKDAAGDVQNNVAIGYQAGMGAVSGHLYNSVAIGYNAKATSSYQIVLGDNSVTQIGGSVEWSVYSDGRIKKNIQQDVPGLTFINKLQPVSYNYDLDAADKITGRTKTQNKSNTSAAKSVQIESAARATKQQIKYSGFVAQDVETAAKSIGYDFSGVNIPKSEHDLYTLKYAEFVVPLVKAVQELSAKNDAKDSVIASLQSQVSDLKTMMQQVLKTGNNIGTTSDNPVVPQNVLLSSATIEQNIPNPFSNTTVIRYNIPQSFSSAQIIITDNAGRILKQIPVTSTGAGAINIDGGSLSAGLYLYSLYINGQLIGTKKMILTK